MEHLTIRRQLGVIDRIEQILHSLDAADVLETIERSLESRELRRVAVAKKGAQSEYRIRLLVVARIVRKDLAQQPRRRSRNARICDRGRSECARARAHNRAQAILVHRTRVPKS